jgi:hypothetical protein
MKACVYAWIPREKPPYFGFMPTWVFIKKFEISSLEEEKLKKIIKKVDEEIGAERYKIIIYDNDFFHQHYFEVTELE